MTLNPLKKFYNIASSLLPGRVGRRARRSVFGPSRKRPKSAFCLKGFWR